MSAKLGPQGSSQVVMPPLVRGAQVSQGCAACMCARARPGPHPFHGLPRLVGLSAIFLSPTSQQIHNIRQHSSTGPPPLLLAPRASVPSMQIQGQRIIQQGLIRVANVPNTSLLVNIPQVRVEPGWEVGVGVLVGLTAPLSLLVVSW